MNILHVIESHTIHTKRIVDYQVQAGHDVHVVTFQDYAGQGPVTVVPVPRWINRLPYAHHWRGLLWWREFLRTVRPDVVHGHYLSTAALYLSWARDQGVVASAMGSDVLIDPGATHARLLLKALPRWVGCFTSGAPHLTRRMVELGIPEQRIETFPWGVDFKMFHPATVPPATPTIVSTRNFESVYDLPTLIHAVVQVAREIPGMRLDLFGDGSLRHSLAEIVRNERLESRVRFVGRVDSPRLAQGLREASTYVSTSKSDAASVSLLEAMASGLVPVVSDIEANRMWVTHGENGLLFPVGDTAMLRGAIRRALSDEELQARARKVNPWIIESRASWGESMRRLEGVYRRVTG
jgi:glycosyltransferase involved in cell wall biosynthesis